MSGSNQNWFVAHVVPKLVAIALTGVVFYLSMLPRLSKNEESQVANRFKFKRIPLPELEGVEARPKRTNLNKNVEHISGWMSFCGAGVALGDLDGDGASNDVVHSDPRYDKVIVSPAPATGQRFTKFTLDPPQTPFDVAPMGCHLGDHNEDGLLDVMVYYWNRSPVIFFQQDRQAGQALTKKDFLAKEFVNPIERWYTNAVVQVDLDGDGHLDLIVGNYFPDGSPLLNKSESAPNQNLIHSLCRAYNGGPVRVYLWSAARSNYVEVKNALARDVSHGFTFGLGAADLDGDQLPEIYIVQDFGPDRLLVNHSMPGKLDLRLAVGRRKFTTPRSKIVGRDTFNGMGVDFGDLNGDGQYDIMVSNITSLFAFIESNFVFMSHGKEAMKQLKEGIAPYTDLSESMGLSRGGWTWEVRMADFDNDTNLEIMQATGFMGNDKGISRWPELHEYALSNDEVVIFAQIVHELDQVADSMAHDEHNPFFVKKGNRYYDIAKALGKEYSQHMLSRAIAVADVDRDGRLDFALANNWEKSFFFHNQAQNPGQFLGLNLRLKLPGTKLKSGKERTRAAVGAHVTVTVGNRRLIRHVDGGTGHSGQIAQEVHFGLGDVASDAPLPVEILWRDLNGKVNVSKLSLTPGWHTRILNEKQAAKK